MKIDHKYSRNLQWRIICGVLLVVLSLSLVAQKSKAPSGLGVAARPADSSLDVRLEGVMFDDIPMSEVVHYLHSAFDGLNFILSEELRDVPVALELRHVTVLEVLEALNLATDGLVHFEQRSERLFYLTVDSRVKKTPQLRAFNLGTYFENFDGEQDEALRELYQVLEQGWKLMLQAGGGKVRGSRPELSIHLKTQLLIAVGQETELAVVESIVDALHGGRSRVMSRARAAEYGMYGGGFGFGGTASGAGMSAGYGAAGGGGGDAYGGVGSMGGGLSGGGGGGATGGFGGGFGGGGAGDAAGAYGGFGGGDAGIGASAGGGGGTKARPKNTKRR